MSAIHPQPRNLYLDRTQTVLVSHHTGYGTNQPNTTPPKGSTPPSRTGLAPLTTVNDPATGFRVCDPGSFTASHDEVCKVVHAWMHPMRDGAPSTCLTCGAINGDDQQAVTW